MYPFPPSDEDEGPPPLFGPFFDTTQNYYPNEFYEAPPVGLLEQFAPEVKVEHATKPERPAAAPPTARRSSPPAEDEEDKDGEDKDESWEEKSKIMKRRDNNRKASRNYRSK